MITGVSSGFGRALAEAIFEKGGKVAGTVRKETAKAEFEKLAPGKAFGILLDVTDEAAVHRGVKEAEEKLGGIDVLVNNAGYGFEGALEEATLADFRAQFDVNVFGAVAMMQAVLPHMRSAAPAISSTSVRSAASRPSPASAPITAASSRSKAFRNRSRRR